MLTRAFNWFREGQFWNSVMRHGVPRDRRTRIMAVMSNVFLHLHPVAVRKSGIRLSFTWCMGGLTFFLFLAETVSGVLLMFYYRPVVEYAYQDIQDLRAHVTMGILREIHRWGAHAMIISIWLHMMRVFLTGSYKPPREFNWVVGVLLLVLTMLLSFTGYLLPWDQLAIWAITVGSRMAQATPFAGSAGPFANFMKFPSLDVPMIHAGSDARFFLLAGTFVGENALLRFYVLHCVALPLVAILTYLLMRAWPVLSWSLLVENPAHYMTAGGLWAPLVGTFDIVVLSLALATPVGVLAGIYLHEYARATAATRIIDLAIVNLAGVPSIVHALFGVGMFVFAAGFGRSVLAASCTLAVMTLPVIIASTREALASVPYVYREACWILGASRWQTVWQKPRHCASVWTARLTAPTRSDTATAEASSTAGASAEAKPDQEPSAKGPAAEGTSTRFHCQEVSSSRCFETFQVGARLNISLQPS